MLVTLSIKVQIDGKSLTVRFSWRIKLLTICYLSCFGLEKNMLGRELHRGAAGCSTGEDFQSDVIDISVTALYVNLLVVGMREGAMEKELQAAASKKISNQMLLTSQSLPFMLIVMEDIAIHVNNSCISCGASVSCY